MTNLKLNALQVRVGEVSYQVEKRFSQFQAMHALLVAEGVDRCFFNIFAFSLHLQNKIIQFPLTPLLLLYLNLLPTVQYDFLTSQLSSFQKGSKTMSFFPPKAATK